MTRHLLRSPLGKSDFGDIVAIDFDGVITDHVAVKSELFKQRGYVISPSETDRQNIVESKGIPESVYNEVSREANLSLNGTPLQSDVERGLKHLSNIGFQLVIITSRFDDEAEEMVDFLSEKNFPVEGYINTAREPKADALQQIGAEMLIDDSYYKLESVLEQLDSDQCKLLFFQHRGNKNIVNINSEITVVDGWEDVISYFGETS